MEYKTLRRVTGWAAIAMVVFWAAQFPLYLINDPSVGIYDGAGGTVEALRIRDVIFTRIMLNLGLYVAAMVFAAGLGDLIRLLGAAGWAAAVAGVLPRWTRWIAYIGALLCAAAVPSMYGGPLDPGGFYNAAGWGPVIIANLPPAVWVVVTAVLLLRSPGPGVAEPAVSRVAEGGQA